MNVNPTAASIVAGTSRAAARGGETDNQASEATRQQSRTDSPTGKAADSTEVDAGDQTGDRGGNGRQVLDVFERSDEEPNQDHQNPDHSAKRSVSPEGAGGNLDLDA